MPGETEQYQASGSVLMAGVKLSQAFGGTGYDERTRLFSDFASRLYFINAKEELDEEDKSGTQGTIQG